MARIEVCMACMLTCLRVGDYLLTCYLSRCGVSYSNVPADWVCVSPGGAGHPAGPVPPAVPVLR